MFKFGFDLEADDVDEDIVASEHQTSEASTNGRGPSPSQTLKSFAEIQLADVLLNQLPSVISYSPLSFPLLDGTILTIARRDLYDARFQVISQDQADDASSPKSFSASEQHEMEFVEAPSDLVSGVYEGGLKTWECSPDLAAYVHSLIIQGGHKTRFQRIIELGCGTAVPSLCLLHHLLSTTELPQQDTEIHLQDYNELVFRLVTVPNLILAWYMSPASETYRQAPHTTSEVDQDSEPFTTSDPTQSGDLQITSALVQAFTQSLNTHRIRIRLFSGSWDTFDLALAGGTYDLVLTSETIYRAESLPSLIELLHRVCEDDQTHTATDASLARSVLQLTLESPSKSYLCLVAAKLVYFGVGGGVSEFVDAVEYSGGATGRVDTVWEQNAGVKRRIMKIVWER